MKIEQLRELLIDLRRSTGRYNALVETIVLHVPYDSYLELKKDTDCKEWKSSVSVSYNIEPFGNRISIQICGVSFLITSEK